MEARVALFKAKSLEKEAASRAAQEERDAAAERDRFLRGPAGLANAAFERGDRVFQYSHDVMSQEAVIVKMVGSSTTKKTADPSEILNAVCDQGWELVSGSFVFVEEGQQSRDKFMSSGQNVAIKGTTVGFYLFRYCPENRRER
jgi:hypothetical protein